MTEAPLPLPWPLDREVWRPIPGVDGYDASSLGRIRSWRSRDGGTNRRSPRVLSPGVNHHGYRTVMVTLEPGRYRRMQLHRLVLMAFVGGHPNRVGRHLGGDPAMNDINSLAWGSCKENTHDAIRHGTFRNSLAGLKPLPRGEMHPKARLRTTEVWDILARLDAGEIATEIARDYGVTPENIYAIRDGRTWGWLTGINQEAAA